MQVSERMKIEKLEKVKIKAFYPLETLIPPAGGNKRIHIQIHTYIHTYICTYELFGRIEIHIFVAMAAA